MTILPKIPTGNTAAQSSNGALDAGAGRCVWQHRHQNLLAAQIGKVHAKVLKQYHAHILCRSLVEMLKGSNQ